jgi:predicted Zn-dependent protease
VKSFLFVVLVFLPASLAPVALVANAQSSATSTALSDADEIRAGAVLAAKYVAMKGLAPTPQIIKIEEYLQRVGDQVASHAQRKLPYRFHFDPDPTFKSAVALPGGQVFVGGGILTYMDTEDQLAAVLGHEIEHIALSQCRDRLIQEIVRKHLAISDFEKLNLEPFMPGYGHDGELAADREGVKLAMETGYSANGAVKLLQTFVILGEQMPGTLSEAKSNLEARIAQIRTLAESQKNSPAEKPLALPQ